MILNFRVVALFIVIALIGASGSAASFYCSKSINWIEMQICSDVELSELDNELGALYLSSKTKDSTIVDQQRHWLRSGRDRCEAIDCLKRAYSARTFEMKRLGNCPVNEKSIQGSWVRVSDGFFEEMAFSSGNGGKLFSSWIHHRPEITGTWKIVDCSIKIVDGSNKIDFDFIPQKFENNTLYLIDEDKFHSIKGCGDYKNKPTYSINQGQTPINPQLK